MMMLSGKAIQVKNEAAVKTMPLYRILLIYDLKPNARYRRLRMLFRSSHLGFHSHLLTIN